ncbi:hypothetical protein O7599_21240 [Streptomyces sp. WMMC500]|uniref:hypothetical protein n=1 Tax=Streptomyces sp. WMMC500 TaxID=3015154 RepID=UPI00248AE5A4|nr:hypothetical protein [Streptomyces sp. WMMC500]WBB58170.1 hypothetical protein O7599_21240 [Streptomyces sp. WMMC500]
MSSEPTPGAEVSTAVHTVAVDAAASGLAAAEHLVHRMDDALTGLLREDGPEGYVVSTHVARAPVTRSAAVVSWRGGPEPARVTARLLAAMPELTAVDGALVTDAALAPGALAAGGEARQRAAGRLARYPGRAGVERRTTPADAVSGSCLDAVEGLAGVTVTPDAVLDATGFARPTWRDGRCTLLVQRGTAGVLVPFEVRHQIACCADH